jgi:membrane protease YdiL (CAAX protease family)
MSGKTSDPAQTAHRAPWPILACLGLILIYPLYAVPVQRSVADLAARVGLTGARVLTESAIWLYAAVALAIALLWERRPISGIGLRRPTLGTLGFGLGGAAAMFAAGAIGAYLIYTVLRQPMEAQAQASAIVSGSVVYAICLAVRAGVVEEILFRGLAIEQLSTLTGNRLLAGAIVTVVFIADHALRFYWAQLVPIAAVSVVLTGLYLWRRDLVANMVAHAVLDGAGLVTLALHAQPSR